MFPKEHPSFVRGLKLTHSLQNILSLRSFLLLCLHDQIGAYVLESLKQGAPHVHICGMSHCPMLQPWAREAIEPLERSWSGWKCASKSKMHTQFQRPSTKKK